MRNIAELLRRRLGGIPGEQEHGISGVERFQKEGVSSWLYHQAVDLLYKGKVVALDDKLIDDPSGAYAGILWDIRYDLHLPSPDRAFACFARGGGSRISHYFGQGVRVVALDGSDSIEVQIHQASHEREIFSWVPLERAIEQDESGAMNEVWNRYVSTLSWNKSNPSWGQRAQFAVEYLLSK